MPPPPEQKVAEKINILIIGASYAGSHVAQELVERLNSHTGLDLGGNPESNYQITIIEPKTAFEAVTGTWNLLAEPDDTWKFDLSVSGDSSSVDVEKLLQSINNSLVQTKFNETFVQYSDSTLANHPNISLFHGVVHRIFANYVEVKIPLYLFSHLPETYQLMLQNDRNYQLLFENRKEVPLVVPRCTSANQDSDSDLDGEKDDEVDGIPRTASSLASLSLQTPKLATPSTNNSNSTSRQRNKRASVVAPPPVLEHNIPSVVDNNDGTFYISVTFPFHVLLNCSGSTSTHPIKSSEQTSNSFIFTQCKDHYEHRSDLIADLIDLFFNYNFEVLTKIPETLHLPLQSLCYLHKEPTKALILHYFPQYGAEVLGENFSDPEHFQSLRVLSLLAYVLRLPIKSLLNYMVVPLKLCTPLANNTVEELNLSANLLAPLQSVGSAQPDPEQSTTTESLSTPARTRAPSTSIAGESQPLSIQLTSTSPPPPPPPPKTRSPSLADKPLLLGSTPQTPSTINHSTVSSSSDLDNNRPAQSQRPSNADQQRPSLQLLPSLNQRNSTQASSTSALSHSTHPNDPQPHISIKSNSRSSLPVGYHLQPLPISNLLSFPLLSEVYHQSLPIPKHNSVFHRFIELSAIRSMLIYSHFTRTDSTLYSNPNLPIIHRLNFIGGGPTSIELIGSFMDIYWNHFHASKKIIKTFQHDLKKKKESTVFNSDVDFSRFDKENLHHPEFHVFCASTLGASLAVSVQKRVKKHYQKAYEGVIHSFHQHDDTMWGVHTTLENQQRILTRQFEQYREEEGKKPAPPKSKGSNASQHSLSASLRWESKFFNKWSQVTIFATGINRSELIKLYKPTQQMMMKETVDKVLAFIARTNTPNADAPINKGFTNPASPTPNSRSIHHSLSRDASARMTGDLIPGTPSDRKHRNPSAHARQNSRQAPSMVESLQNMTKHHEQFSNLLTRIPGMIFILGDASINPGQLPMAYSAVTSAPVVAENVVLYINKVLRPLLESIAAPYANQLVIPGSGGQPNPSSKVVTPLVLDETIKAMGNASATPDMMVVHFGQFDAVITSSQSQVTRFLPFGNTIALELKKSNRGEALDKIRLHKSGKHK